MSDAFDLNRACRDFRATDASRRGFLHAGVLGTAGLSLAGLLRGEAAGAAVAAKNPPAAAAGNKKLNNVIILWMRGGPSHIDMWDPKPDAPEEFRGEFGTINSKVPGIQLTDMLPKTAAITDQWSIVRSLHHGDAGHSTGDQMCFTGYGPGRNPDENVSPSCGSIVAEQLGKLNPELPAYVMIPKMVPGTGAGYLGVSYKPFETGADPAQTGPFKVENFALAEGLSVNRLGDRRQLLSGLDKLRAQVDASGRMDATDQFGQKAWDVLSSPAAQKAFDLDSEPAHIRERYGFMPAFDPGAADRCGAPAWSQRMLLARRLVEAGVRLVTVDLRWWDTHVMGFDSLRRGFLPRWDQAYTALIKDLSERGLLERTLVVAWGEFGRTPRVNNNAGRDHYPNVFSAALAGGKVKGGRIVGSSDSKGAFPKDNPKTPQDVLATIYDHLGVDIHRHYLNDAGRPMKTLPFGTPIRELF
ncbi:MAG: DUF1501 domain-containing protein [Pirellulaceae bacterium]|nr:DUF1501 domain-containing protein [Pirellulaceae bacterium]